MKSSVVISIAIIMFSTLKSFGVQAAPSNQPPRWVLANDVRVRSEPNPESKVTGTLSRGAELILKSTTQSDGYCFIEGEGNYGYVACEYLSAKRVARPRAGVDGVDATQRWVSGNAVILREEARSDAPVVSRLGLNTIVKLLRQGDQSGYCQIELADGNSGFTACSYLVLTPVVLAHVLGLRSSDQPPSPDYDPVRAFWLEPSWWRLEAYAEHLRTVHANIPRQGPWPRDEALERMKAHLALGFMGKKPEPYPDWLELKRKASQDNGLNRDSRHLQQLWQSTVNELQYAIGISGELSDPISGDEGTNRVVGLVRSLEFPIVTASLFRNESELAPPVVSAEEASGRFGIVFRQLITPRINKMGVVDDSGAGLYDMLARTQLLVRPVKKVQLFRDGRFSVEPSLVRVKEMLWRDVDEPECSGWVPGFAFGDASPRIWRYFGDEATFHSKLNSNPKGSLYQFYTNIDLPSGLAIHTEVQVKLDRKLTGFVRGVHLYYDFDSDGTPDIAVWEGEGKGPGHLEEATTTDDRWYRLVLANINGAWKVLGSDEFGYGCGC